MREKYGLADPYFLFVGNIEPKKNVDQIIKAFFAVKLEKKIPHRLVLAGRRAWKSGPVFRLVRELGMKELGMDGHIRFLGHVPDGDLPLLYAGAEAFLFPSHWEGFGLPPLEAMASGVPVIASKAPVFAETLGEAALAVESTDLPGLRAALIEFLKDPRLGAQLKERGLARVKAFTWERAARATIEVYEEAAAEMGPV